MRQLTQSARTGDAVVKEVPAPAPRAGSVVVRTAVSLVSVGTERTAVEFARRNLLAKAVARPDLVHQVLDKVHREGILAALEAVRGRLDAPLSLGYSSAGTVVVVGQGIKDIQVGNRVACAGAGYAAHAEVICVPRNLIVPIPERARRNSHPISFEEAAFTTLGSVALHAVRLSEAKLGEAVAVIGLGILGQLTVQLLRAAGCRVAGMDIRAERAQLAFRLGAEATATSGDEMLAACHELSRGRGVDAVLVTADTGSDEPVHLAGEIARDRGVVVAAGAVGMNVPRRLYYEKELDFRVSRSYGPGRYDPAYEEGGHDYPLGYVRWTENRNMEGFLQLLTQGAVDVTPLIAHRLPIEEAARVYDLIADGGAGTPLAILIHYPEQPDLSRRVNLSSRVESDSEAPAAQPAEQVRLGVLGAGNFARNSLLPVLKRIDALELVGVCAGTGLSARHAGERFGFSYCTTDEDEILRDPKVNAIAILTRHHLHAPQVVTALKAGKHVFVEKPLALTAAELDAVVEAYGSWGGGKVLQVGFNRRFAPLAARLKGFLADVHEPLLLHYRVNAGYLPPDHWTQDPLQGGGRIIGEACHFLDFVSWLLEKMPLTVSAQGLPDRGRYSQDNVVITVTYPDGSIAVITYLASGDRRFGKERLEVHGAARSAVLEDFCRLVLVKNGRRQVQRIWGRTDKGHRGEWEAFAQAVRAGAPSPVPFVEGVATTRATFAAVESLRLGGGKQVCRLDFA